MDQPKPKCTRVTNRLLTGVLVMQSLTLLGLWAGVPSASTAHAAGGTVIPDPGARQIQMVDELKAMNSKLDKLVTLLEGGRLQVKVTRDDENERK